MKVSLTAISDEQLSGNIYSGLSPLQKMLALEQRYFLADHNLNYTDKMGMAAVRKSVCHFWIMNLWNSQREPDVIGSSGGAKIALKAVASRRLPKEIVTRPKTGFGVPLRRWLKEELRDYVNDTLSVDRIKRRGIFRRIMFRSCWLGTKQVSETCHTRCFPCFALRFGLKNI